MRAIGPILVLALLRAQATGPPLAPEVLALAHASRLVRATVAALANCACLESVIRSTTDKSGKLKREKHDTLQIEATTIGDREWFSWPGGEDAFVEDPRALVSFGLINTGQLTSILKTVFLSGYAVRKFHGVGTFRARAALQFDYAVSPVFTRFLVSSPEGSVRAGMKGTFWIDAANAELLALSNEATEIPADFDVRSARTEVIYAPMYLEDRRVVLPQTSTTVVGNATGEVSMNQVEFSHCRPYSSTSVIRFGDEAAAAPAAAPVHREQPPVPAGLTLHLRLGSPLNARTAVGERFSLIMEAETRSHGDTIIAKGAKVEGRVRWIESTECPSPCLALAIELLSVTTPDGTSRPVYASLRQVTPESKVSLDVTAAARKRTTLPFGRQEPQLSALSLGMPKIPGVGNFVVLTPDLRTPLDFSMTWTTESPRRP